MAMVSSSLPIPPFPIPVFLDSTLDTRLAVLVSSDDTVASLRRMIEMDHAVNFPEIGSVIVKSIKVMFKGSLYNMCNSMLVKSVLRGDKKRLFLHVEVVPAPNSNSKGPASGERKKLNDKDCEINLIPNQATNNNVQTDKGKSNGTEANRIDNQNEVNQIQVPTPNSIQDGGTGTGTSPETKEVKAGKSGHVSSYRTRSEKSKMASPDPDVAAKENEFLNGLHSNACLERETSLSDADQIILSTLMDLKKRGHEESKANEEPGCQSLADSETGKALNGENKDDHYMVHNFDIEKVNIIDYLRPETTNEPSETKKRSNDPNQQSETKKRSKESKKKSNDPKLHEETKKRSNGPEQSNDETRKRSKDPWLSEQTKKGSKDPQQSNNATKNKSKDPEKSNGETKKGSKDPELSKDESKKKSKDSEKSKDQSKKKSKDPELSNDETRKRSKDTEKPKEETKKRKRSKGPEQSKEGQTRSKGPEQSKEEPKTRSKGPEKSKEETRKRSKDPEQSKEETSKRSKDPAQSKEETKKGSKDPEQSKEETKKGSKDPEQSKEETKKGSKDPEQSKEETKKGSKDPEQSKEETKKGSKDPEQSKEETKKGSKDPEQSKEETKKGSKDPEQSKEETKRISKDLAQPKETKMRSKDPEQYKEETRKRSKGAEQSKETKKRSKDPKPSLCDDMAYLSESMGSEDEAERYKVAIRVPSKKLAASAFIFNDDDNEIQSNSICRGEQDTRPSWRLDKKLVNNEKKVSSGVDKKLKNDEKGIILALQSQTT